jgi:hypothetical protein
LEELAELYREFEKDAKERRNLDSKAEKVRVFVSNLAAYMEEDRLCFDAVFKMVCVRILSKPINKSYFKQVIDKTWVLEEDEDKVLWIRVDLPRRK